MLFYLDLIQINVLLIHIAGIGFRQGFKASNTDYTFLQQLNKENQI